MGVIPFEGPPWPGNCWAAIALAGMPSTFSEKWFESGMSTTCVRGKIWQTFLGEGGTSCIDLLLLPFRCDVLFGEEDIVRGDDAAWYAASFSLLHHECFCFS